MRHAARVYLRDEPTGMDQFDPAELSREMIQAGDRKVLAGAIVSLGETGTKADAAWLRLFVSDPNEAIAGAAVQAVARLEGAASREWLLALMSSDGRERVVREAGRSLERPESEREVEQLAYVFRSDSPRHCRRAALTLLLRLNAFEALVYATEAMDSNDEALRQRAGGFMWRTRWKGVFTTPTESQRRAMEVALRAHGAALSLSERRIVMRVFGLAENP